MPNVSPIVFTGQINSANERGNTGRAIHVKVECWPEKFKVAVWSMTHRNEREWTTENWRAVVEHLNHRYATTLPLEYPASDGTMDLDSMFPEGDVVFNDEHQPKGPGDRPPARLRSSRIIED